MFILSTNLSHLQISNWSPGQGIANILNSVGGITGQFATAPMTAVKQTQQIYRDFRDLLF